MNILLADDDPLFRIFVEELCVQRGHRVRVVNDGAAAWQVLQESPRPDVAILDWEMPGMTGYDLCLRMRASAALRATRIILYSARNAEDQAIAARAGADVFLVKPVEMDTLEKHLQEFESQAR